MIDTEYARRKTTEYETGTVAAQAEFATFQEENGSRLAAIQSEFEDYSKHPLWMERTEKEAATERPAATYRRWHDEEGDLLGWKGLVLLHGERYINYYHHAVKVEQAERSKLPLTVEEFDRRAAIAKQIGEVATMLQDHQGEPVVSIAGYDSSLTLKTTSKWKSKIDDSYSYRGYKNGKISRLSKTRVIIGAIDQPDSEPALELRSSDDEKTTAQALRLTVANNLAGIVCAYSVPSDKRQLRQQITPPNARKVREFRENKTIDLPVGSSTLGNFPFSQLVGRDLLVIDGPHRTAADYEFSDGIVPYRPKQKIEVGSQQTRDQEIIVTPPPNAEKYGELYEATVISENGEVTLVAPRHDTIWLVGRKAIEANLEDAIRDATTGASRHRGTDQAILRAARDLVKFAGNGQPAAELAA